MASEIPDETQEAIDELSRAMSAFMSALAIQMVEVQAMVNVLLDLERDRLVREGQSKTDVAQFVEASFQVNRNSVYQVVRERLLLANLDIDLGGPIH